MGGDDRDDHVRVVRDRWGWPGHVGLCAGVCDVVGDVRRTVQQHRLLLVCVR